MKNMKRAERRHHKRRLKAKARKIALQRYQNMDMAMYDMYMKFVQHTTNQCDYLAVCSCYECGNPRRYRKGPTRKETMSDISFQEQKAELT